MSQPDSSMSLRNIKRIIYSKLQINRASLYGDASAGKKRNILLNKSGRFPSSLIRSVGAARAFGYLLDMIICRSIYIRLNFKHNTSFVSRFSTIRRHRPPFTHSPMTRSRCSDVNTSSDNLSGRIRPSVSEDSVSKDFSETSKRNSDEDPRKTWCEIIIRKVRKVPVIDNLGALHFKYDQARRRFVEWAQNEIAVVPDFHKRILFSDEAHFWLNGYVNKQNCRIWSEANPQVYVETPLHPEKLTVWCALWAGGIIGPYFFKNDEGHNVTVNGDRYRAMITNFFIPELNHHDVQELWFQQDGATCHTARATIDLLKDTFGDLLISRFGPVNWPPRSCDLTPLDYFL
ncbi:uncharacterized protein TNCV_3239871 [Trichonephila clavipes]|nr:uncharacterized protein TNCV_3239871 [Trichonephila clavipes]